METYLKGAAIKFTACPIKKFGARLCNYKLPRTGYKISEGSRKTNFKFLGKFRLASIFWALVREMRPSAGMRDAADA